MRQIKKKGKIAANKITAYGIEFKSNLEKNVFKYLKEHKFEPEYEPNSYVLWEGGPTRTPFYNAKTGHLKCFKADLSDITYTPDFEFWHGTKHVFIEAKGFENDSFPIRKKLFRRWLDEHEPDAWYFEVRSVMQLKDALEILEHGKIISKTTKKK